MNSFQRILGRVTEELRIKCDRQYTKLHVAKIFRAKLSLSVQNGPEVHPTICIMGTGCLFREYSDRGMAFNTLPLVALKLYRDSNKFPPDFKSVPTWTCCSSMHSFRLTTYNHTLFCKETTIPLIEVHLNAHTLTIIFREEESAKVIHSLCLLVRQT
jgi:hypothetical protein